MVGEVLSQDGEVGCGSFIRSDVTYVVSDGHI